MKGATDNEGTLGAVPFASHEMVPRAREGERRKEKEGRNGATISREEDGRWRREGRRRERR
jgi:hypothetical protein